MHTKTLYSNAPRSSTCAIWLRFAIWPAQVCSMSSLSDKHHFDADRSAQTQRRLVTSYGLPQALLVSGLPMPGFTDFVWGGLIL